MTIDRTNQELMNAAVMAKTLRIDPPRAEAQKKFRITTKCSNLTLFGQFIQGDEGGAVINVYESQIPELFDLLEDATPAQIDVARADFEQEKILAANGEQSTRHCLPSFESSFRAMFRRDPKPILTIEEIGKTGATGSKRKKVSA